MPNAARTTGGLFVAATPLDAASPLLPAWAELARDPLVENLFFESDFALAAQRAFGRGIRLLTVSDRPPEQPGARLLALWPCRIVRRWGVPIPALMGWTHGFSIFGAPLLAKDEAAPALRALLDAPRHLGLPKRLMMPYLPLDGAFAELLDETLSRSGSRRVDFWAHERGFFDPHDARKTYLDSHLSARKAQQLGRLFRRISAGEPVEHEIIREPERLAEALDDYVALEAAGWKGRAGTAVAKRPTEAAFLAGLVRSYGAGGRLRFDRLRRNGRSLAAALSLETGSTFWFLKIAHDEAEAKNSPGALLVERVTRSLLTDIRLATADSCAPPNFSLIETFWSERRRLAHGLVEAGGGDPWFRIAAALEGTRAQASRIRAAKTS